MWHVGLRLKLHVTVQYLKKTAITYYVPSNRPARTKLRAASIFVPTHRLQTHRNLQKVTYCARSDKIVTIASPWHGQEVLNGTPGAQ